MAKLRDLTSLGADDVTVRVSAYDWEADPHGVPCQWQAIVKHRDRTKAWSVAVRDDPVVALQDAINGFAELYDDGMDMV